MTKLSAQHKGNGEERKEKIVMTMDKSVPKKLVTMQVKPSCQERNGKSKIKKKINKDEVVCFISLAYKSQHGDEFTKRKLA